MVIRPMAIVRFASCVCCGRHGVCVAQLPILSLASPRLRSSPFHEMICCTSRYCSLNCKARCIGPCRACGRFDTVVQCHLGKCAWVWTGLVCQVGTVACHVRHRSRRSVKMANSLFHAHDCLREMPCRCRDRFEEHANPGDRCVRARAEKRRTVISNIKT